MLARYHSAGKHPLIQPDSVLSFSLSVDGNILLYQHSLKQGKQTMPKGEFYITSARPTCQCVAASGVRDGGVGRIKVHQEQIIYFSVLSIEKRAYA
jgi:hypothetical protein